MDFPFLDPDFEVDEGTLSRHDRSKEWWEEYKFYHAMKREYFAIHNKYRENSNRWWDQWRDHAEARRDASRRMGAMKIATIREYAIQHDCKVFIETGTYYGETTLAVCEQFEDVFTVEIEPTLYEQNGYKFEGKNIEAHLGDSKILLPELVAKAGDRKILFWLDAHWCGGGQAPEDRMSPVQSELEYIFSLPDSHVVLVDDARYFGGLAERDAEAEGYPDQEWVKENAAAAGYSFLVQRDIIRLVKK